MPLRAAAVLVVLLAVFGSPASASAESVGAAYVLANGTGVERDAIIDPVAEGIRQCAASGECIGRMVGTVEVGIASGAGDSKLANFTKPGRSGPDVAGTVDDVAESSVAAGGVRAGQAGRHADLVRAGTRGDNLTPHHMPQAAQKFTSTADGGSLVLPHSEHVLTRTYGSGGRATLRAEQGMSFRDVLARDLRDIRSNFGSKYDQGLRDLLKYYRQNFPDLMAR